MGPNIYTQFATSCYEVMSMQSIKLTGESKKCFHYFHLIPDSKLLVKEHESTSYDCKAQDLLGKSKENLSKVKTTFFSYGVQKVGR